EAGFQSNMYWSSSPANSSEQYVVSLATGDQSVFEKLGFAYATCYKKPVIFRYNFLKSAPFGALFFTFPL
ncbi:TPA: hypothetical protein ACH9PP_004151, partial [Escherichia coli]